MALLCMSSSSVVITLVFLLHCEILLCSNEAFKNAAVLINQCGCKVVTFRIYNLKRNFPCINIW